MDGEYFIDCHWFFISLSLLCRIKILSNFESSEAVAGQCKYSNGHTTIDRPQTDNADAIGIPAASLTRGMPNGAMVAIENVLQHF